ncbi:MAG: response regulator [Candidatus Magnetomorum sp.]|nr:response regulator [Candidatus Magnetomorum sp.]
MKLLYQLLLIILIPLICIAGLSFLQFDWMLDQMKTQTNARMNYHIKDVRHHFNLAISQIRTITEIISKDTTIKKSLANRDTKQLCKKARAYMAFNISGALFLDPSFQVLCQMDHLPVISLTSSLHPIFQKAAFSPQCSLVDIQNALYILAVYPVKTDDHIDGYIVAGMPVFPHLIEEIVNHLKIQLKIEYKGTPVGNYLDDVSLDFWERETFSIQIEDVTLKITLFENNILSRTTSELRRDYLTFSLTIIAIFILGITSFVKKLISPMNQLVSAMNKYSKGELKLSLLPNVKNEIGNLSQAFHRMIINLEHAEQRFRRIFEHAIEGIFQSHPEGYFIRANPAMAKILGYSSPDRLMESITDLATQLYVNPKDREQFKSTLTDNNQVNNSEVQMYRQDQSIIWVSVNAKNVRNRNGDLLYYEGFLVDITERKTREHVERERKALEIANRTKSEFLANISHEIRTPLNAVLGLGKLLNKTNLNETQKDYLTDMLTSSRTLLELINDILDYSQVEIGSLKLMKSPFYLMDIYQNILSIFKQQIQIKKIAMVIQLPKECAIEFIGDPMRIKQILINLLGNAVKFTDKGQIWIQTDSPHQTADEIYISISVTDTGIGIQETDQQRIFQAFTQADASSTRKYCGTGLGLAICEKLVYKMNGKMFVTSIPSKGSTFSITIPLAYHPKDGEEPSIKMPEIYNRILVIEDDAVNAKFVKSVFKDTIMDVHMMPDGHALLKHLKQYQYDMIFMDIQLPEIDGYELTQTIRQSGRVSLPVIALTACAMKGDREKCLAAGMNDYLPKPFEPDDLLSIYHKWKGSVQPDSPKKEDTNE